MRKMLPGFNEVGIFAVMALVCAAVAHVMPAPEVGMAVFSIPVFITAAVIGLWKSGRLRADD
jgi:hypothetical protein